MKKMHSFIKHLVAILLGTALVGMSVYAVQIPTSLNNAIQYIMETVWTSDGTASGTTNVQVWTGGIYIATGFLSNGNAWNNMSLGLDASGNVVYVPGGSSTPIFSLAGDFIPKLDAAGTALELSVMYQNAGLIGVNMTNPSKSVDILGDFGVHTQGTNVTYQYNFVNSNTGLGYPPVDINTAPRCSCDINQNTADCTTPSFASANDQGYYCVDLTIQNNGNYYDHNVYVRQTIGIPSPVLVTSGSNVGVDTNNPQASLDVSGNVMIATTPAGLNTWDVLTINPTTREVSTRSAGSFLGGTATGYSLTSLGGGTSLLGLTISSPGNILWNTKSLVAGPGISLSSTSTEITISALGGSSNGWNLTGNAGTNTSTHFLGTTDNQGLVVKVNNTQIQRYYTNGSMIGGFAHTYTAGSYGVIAGGSGNTLSGDYASIGGGGMNYALGYASTIGGGFANVTTGTTSTIAGGISNFAPGDDSFIGGGSMNTARGYRSSVVGGRNNQATGDYTSIVGGESNTVSGLYGFIGGGLTNNIISSTQSVIGGGLYNRILANSNGSVIVGGSGNVIDGQFGSTIFIGGGNTNTGSWANAVVVGGALNQATQNSFVGGGIGNRAIGNPILFGPSNVVVGGNFNTAQGIAGAIGGGVGNVTLGSRATVPGGFQNTGAGDYSFAAGQFAIASGDNSFVWSDGYTTLNSNANIRNNEFRVNSYVSALGRASNTSWAYNFYGGSSPTLSATFAFGVLATDNLWAENALFVNNPVVSDQSLKEDVVDASEWGTQGLSIIEALNPVTFRWKDNGTASEMGLDPTQLHYGFIAQEVEAVVPEIIRTLDFIDGLGLSSRAEAAGPLKSIESIEMVPILVQAIKEQQALITDLQARVLDLETP